MSVRLKPESVKYPYFMFFIIYNRETRTWHGGGMKEFKSSKYVTGAKVYQSYDYAEKVVRSICGGNQSIGNFVILRYTATATEALEIEEEISGD